MTAKARFPRKSAGRITFTVQVRNHSDMLLAVVSLFHELNIGIDAIYMIRRTEDEKVNIILAVQMEWERAAEVGEYLTNIAGVLSIKTEMDTKTVVRDPPSN